VQSGPRALHPRPTRAPRLAGVRQWARAFLTTYSPRLRVAPKELIEMEPQQLAAPCPAPRAPAVAALLRLRQWPVLRRFGFDRASQTKDGRAEAWRRRQMALMNARGLFGDGDVARAARPAEPGEDAAADLVRARARRARWPGRGPAGGTS